MINLNFIVEGQIMQRTDKNLVVNKSKGYIFTNFLFDEEWEGMQKFALFKNDHGKTYACSLGSSTECRCSVPAQAMTGKYFKVSVYGGEGEDLLTSNLLNVVLLPSGYTTSIEDPSHNNVGVDAFVEVYEKLESKISRIEYEDGYLKCYAGNVFLQETPIFRKQDFRDEIKEEIKELMPYFEVRDGDLYVIYPE